MLRDRSQMPFSLANIVDEAVDYVGEFEAGTGDSDSAGGDAERICH